MPAQFHSGLVLSFPGPMISAIEISPGRTAGSTRTVTWSPRPSTAQPRKSKPGPRFATVAGANALTEVNTGSGSVVTRVGREALHLRVEGLGLIGDEEMEVVGK